MAQSTVLTHEEFVNLLASGEWEYLGDGGIDIEGRTITISKDMMREEFELGLKDN